MKKMVVNRYRIRRLIPVNGSAKFNTIKCLLEINDDEN